MFTNTEFPVDNGATITVYCQGGHVKVGSSVVTCNTDLKENSCMEVDQNQAVYDQVNLRI